MKRILAMVLLLVMLSSLAACGNSKESSNDSDPQSFKDTVTPDIIIETDPTDDETNNVPPTVDNDGANSEDGNDSSNEEQHEHTYEKQIVSPTCEKDGYTTYSCDCGAQYTEDYIIANGHSYGSWVETKAATETTVGKEKRQCKNCEKTETRNIPKIIKGHTHNFTLSSTQSSTCQMDGFRTYYCSCGTTYTEPISIIPHTYQKETVDPTCADFGYTKFTCTSCGDSYLSNYIYNKPKHNYTDTVTKPTCTKAGYTTHTCKTCGDTYTDSKKNALGHSWGSWSTVTPAEVGKTGIEIRICSVCNESQTQTIPALKEDTSINPTVISIQFPQTPLYVNTINFNTNIGDYGISRTVRIDNFYYKIDRFGQLFIYCSGEKTYDIKGTNNTSSCELKWRLYDMDGYLINSGWDSISSLRVGDKFKDHCINIVGINFTEGESYRLEVYDANYEFPLD